MKLKIYKPISLPTRCATEGESVKDTSLERVKLECKEVEVDVSKMFNVLRKVRRYLIDYQHDDLEAGEILLDIDSATDWIDA